MGGWTELNRRQNPENNSDFTRYISEAKNKFFAARVKDIILDENHPKFIDLGEWNALGVIEYDPILSPSGVNSNIFSIAYPLTPNIKNYPLINEIVYIIQLPDQNLGNTNSSEISYYINIVSLWNHPHHNAYPSLANEPPPPQQKDYIQTQAGSTNIVTDENKQIFLGKTFVEKTNIHPLLPFEGDIIQEGRWGNSIRFGSTVTNSSSTIKNNWSSTGNNGDPITILRNGQGEQGKEGWIPIVEDINNSDSSIYLTSTQQIPLIGSSTNYVSYSGSIAPDSLDKFSGQQIILNSGRLVFNSYSDHILLSSAKTINLNSQESVNIDTKDFIIQSRGNIYLGSYEANEPLLKGNLTVDLLSTLIQTLKQFSEVLKTQSITSNTIPEQPATIPAFITYGVVLGAMMDSLDQQLNDLTSKYNFTI